MSVGSKLALLVLALPMVILLSTNFAAFYFYKVETDVSALISSTVVILLVWERLRGSLRRDLRWFHKYVLFGLYSKIQPKMHLYHIETKPIKRLRADLVEYGRSMGLHLYPKELPEMIDKFLELNEDFSPKLKKIEEWGEKKLSHYEFYAFLYYLGIEPVLYSSPGEEVEKSRKEGAQKLLKEQPELVPEARDLIQKMRERREQIHEILDDFIKDNKLRLEPEPAFPGSDSFG